MMCWTVNVQLQGRRVNKRVMVQFICRQGIPFVFNYTYIREKNEKRFINKKKLKYKTVKL